MFSTSPKSICTKSMTRHNAITCLEAKMRGVAPVPFFPQWVGTEAAYGTRKREHCYGASNCFPRTTMAAGLARHATPSVAHC